MAVLKQLKFGNVQTPIAITQVALAQDNVSALSMTSANTGLNDNADPTYTLKLAVDGKTITGTTELATALKLSYHPAVTTVGEEKGAYIALEDNTGTSIANSEIPVEDIIGNGILDSSAYDSETGILTLTFANADGTTTDVEVDLKELFDIDDIVVDQTTAKDYLSFTVVDPAAEEGQAVLGVKLADVTYTQTSGSTPATLTVDSTNGKMLDATDAVPAIKSYVDDVAEQVTNNATGDNYITVAQDSTNKKQINITADVQNLTASAGTRGTYTVANDGTVTLAGETAPSISGVADSLVDGSDVATKVATYVDAKVAAEAARTDANIEGAVKALDYTDTANASQAVTAVNETDGVIAVTRANISGLTLAGFDPQGTSEGAIAASDTLGVALKKLENKADAIQYQINGTTLEFFGITEKPAAQQSEPEQEP